MLRRLEEEIRALMARECVPGVSLALLRDGQPAWDAGFGLRGTDSGQPMTVDTVFQAASLSKPVFAYGVLMLVEHGVLELDRPLTEYLPDRFVANDDLLEHVTARHVLSHTTGWPNWRPRGELLRRESSPGERFGYSGEGYVYLQRVVEHVTAQPLDTFMRARVFEPTGMLHSSFACAVVGDQLIAGGHDRDGAPIVRHSGDKPNAASSMRTTARDFGRFLQVLLTSGDEPWRLRRASVSEMLGPQVWVGDRMAWGLGWGLTTTHGGESVWHWGDNPGYKSFTVAQRNTGTGLVVMTNGDAGLAVCARIVRAFVGDHPALVWLSWWYQQTGAQPPY